MRSARIRASRVRFVIPVAEEFFGVPVGVGAGLAPLKMRRWGAFAALLPTNYLVAVAAARNRPDTCQDTAGHTAYDVGTPGGAEPIFHTCEPSPEEVLRGHEKSTLQGAQHICGGRQADQ